MDTSDNTTSEQQEPFWDSAQAQEGTAPAQSEPQTVSVPQGQIMGDLAQQPEPQSISPPQAHIIGNITQQQPESHFSATVNNPAQFNSASSITGGYDMSEKKKGPNWVQFALGFFVPIAVMIIFSVVLSGSDGAYDERWSETYKSENVFIISENGTFTHTFDDATIDYGRYAVDWCMSADSGEYEYRCEWNQNRDEGYEISETPLGDWDNNRMVGNYYPQNNTIWLTTDSHNYSLIEFNFDFVDEKLEQELESEYSEDSSLGDSLMCFMPVLAIVVMVVSFARGNKSLGWGIFTSTIAIPLAMFAFFFTLLMLYGF